MWFKNLQLFRLPEGWAMTPAGLEEALGRYPLAPCTGLQSTSQGWVSPRGNQQLVYSFEKQLLIAMGVEDKILPASVVNDVAAEKAEKMEAERGFKPGRKMLRQIKDEVTVSLLPRAFARRKVMRAWLDPQSGWLVVDAASSGAAEDLVEFLRTSLGGSFAATRVEPDRSSVSAMTDWVTSGRAPGNFDIHDECELCSTDQERATVRYLRHSLEGEDIRRHISNGKVVIRLGLLWNERLSLVMDDKLQLKRFKFVDINEVAEEAQSEDPDEQFDLDFVLMSGELRKLLDELMSALGAD